MTPTGPRISRRRFLQAVGAAGGAAAVLGSMEALRLVAPAGEHRQPFQPPRKSDFALQGRANGTRVLILGAGIAGLTTAYELEKAGYACEILEARERPGGRNWTVRGGTTETEIDGPAQTASFARGPVLQRRARPGSRSTTRRSTTAASSASRSRSSPIRTPMPGTTTRRPTAPSGR